MTAELEKDVRTLMKRIGVRKRALEKATSTLFLLTDINVALITYTLQWN